ELAAILANAPAVVLEAPLRRRVAQLGGGPVAGAVGLVVEDGKVLAEDFAGRVALDALGAGVPADDAAFGVEQEDRVLLHAIGHELEQLRRRSFHALATPHFRGGHLTKAREAGM